MEIKQFSTAVYLLRVCIFKGFKACRRKIPSGHSVSETTSECEFDGDVIFSSSLNEEEISTEIQDKDEASKQLKHSVKIDNDISKFLMKRKKYSAELKDEVSRLGAEVHVTRGFIIITKNEETVLANWEKQCNDEVNQFCSRFQKERFVVDREIKDSISEALLTLQETVSTLGAACWIDKDNQGLILVSLKVKMSDAVQKVNEFLIKIRMFARRCFDLEESIHGLVEKNLQTLKDALKSCKITLTKKSLEVVCVRNEVDTVNKNVENFLQRLKNNKEGSGDSSYSYWASYKFSFFYQ